MNDNQDQKFEQIRQMLATRYGRGFEFRRMGDASENDLSADYIARGEDLVIPLRINSSYLGTAIIPQGASLDAENHQQISQLIKLVLEPSLYSAFLERTENNLRAEMNQVAPEIVPIHGRNSSESLSTRPRLTSNLIYFRGHDVQRTRKAALLLHEMTGRWAFVPWSDIEKDISTAMDLKRLGSVTLFCENIEQMSLAHQKILSTFGHPGKSADEPLVIIGGAASITSLREDAEHFDPAFLESLVTQSLDLNRTPLSETGLREVLEIMYVRDEGEF